jgi:hypothetical protein
LLSLHVMFLRCMLGELLTPNRKCSHDERTTPQSVK